MGNLKNKVIKVLSALPLAPFFSGRYAGLGSILFMHKVVDEQKDTPRISLMQANEIDIVFLEKMLVHLKKKGYDFISLDAIPERLASGIKRKFIVFTFDDGYKDNLTLAYPVFKKHQIPFTIYVTNCFPNKTAQLWWYVLEDILLEQKEISLQIAGKELNLSTKTMEQKELAFLSLREQIISATPEKQNHIIDQFEQRYGKKVSDYVERETLSWEEIARLQEDPLVTIGGHTLNHVTLNQLTEKEALAEIIQSAIEIETHTNSKTKHFAYPFGTPNEVNEREIGWVKNSGHFTTATTTRMGNIFKEHLSSLHALPRIQVLGNQQDLAILKLYLSGVLPALKNKLKKVVTL